MLLSGNPHETGDLVPLTARAELDQHVPKSTRRASDSRRERVAPLKQSRVKFRPAKGTDNAFNRNLHESYTYTANLSRSSHFIRDTRQQFDGFHAYYMPTMCDIGRKISHIRP